MPAILTDPDDIKAWLGTEQGQTPGWDHRLLSKLLKPYEGTLLCYPVQTEVGPVGNSSPTFILPVADRKDGIKSFFQKAAAKSSTSSSTSPSKLEPLPKSKQKLPVDEEEWEQWPGDEIASISEAALKSKAKGKRAREDYEAEATAGPLSEFSKVKVASSSSSTSKSPLKKPKLKTTSPKITKDASKITGVSSFDQYIHTPFGRVNR